MNTRNRPRAPRLCHHTLPSKRLIRQARAHLLGRLCLGLWRSGCRSHQRHTKALQNEPVPSQSAHPGLRSIVWVGEVGGVGGWVDVRVCVGRGGLGKGYQQAHTTWAYRPPPGNQQW
jgi:hypothetical protein